jgi:carboxypeptidase family protein
MPRRAVVWSIVVASLPTGVLAQVIRGRVLDVASGDPVAAAAVTVVTDGRTLTSTESDSAGAFRVAVRRAGKYTLRVERIGYSAGISGILEVGARETVEVTIRLDVMAVHVQPLLVVERRTRTQPLPEFERRFASSRKSGLGVFITREALDSTTAHSVTDLLGRVSLLGLQREQPVSYSQGGCVPTLYLNGARFQLATGESIDDMIQPNTLEGVEIYRNQTELPREFAGIGHCAAIVFWTRVGESTRGGSWRFLIAGGAILGLIVFFIAN